MGDVVVIESEDSEESIVEVEAPKKPTPPLINLEEEEIILNVMQENREDIVAKDFIETDKELSIVSNMAVSSQQLNSPNHWTSDMIKFYDDDWGDEEHFVVEKIQEKMDKTPSLWEVSRKDVLNIQNKIRKSNVRCWNCKQRGHHFTLCPDPPHTPKCHMCGSEGHLDYSCPNSKCLNCGSRSREFVMYCYKCRNESHSRCSRCHILGHSFINCPDHWRLFHMTTGTTSVRIPDRNIHKPSKEIWCCNCGKKGHHNLQCTRSKGCSGFMDTLPYVVSYHKAFRDNQVSDTPTVEPKKKRRGHRGKGREKILKLNPMHKAITKDRFNLKNNINNNKNNKDNLRRLEKIKKHRKKKKGNEDLLGPLIV